MNHFSHARRRLARRRIAQRLYVLEQAMARYLTASQRGTTSITCSSLRLPM